MSYPRPQVNSRIKAQLGLLLLHAVSSGGSRPLLRQGGTILLSGRMGGAADVGQGSGVAAHPAATGYGPPG